MTEKEGRDDGKEGHVTVISAATNTVTGIVTLNPLADTGFSSDGSTLDRITVPPAAAGSFKTGAFPNLLQSIVVLGKHAYLPNTASSPNGPFKFNVNVQGFLSVFDTGTDTDSGQTINMNNGVQNEDPKVKLFITNPIAIAFDRTGTEGWVVSAATNRIIRVTLDANGTPTINPPPPPPSTGPFPPDTIVRVEVGLNPQGIVLNSTATRAYVENFISRDLSVVDIGSVTPKQLARLQAPIFRHRAALRPRFIEGTSCSTQALARMVSVLLHRQQAGCPTPDGAPVIVATPTACMMALPGCFRTGLVNQSRWKAPSRTRNRSRSS